MLLDMIMSLSGTDAPLLHTVNVVKSTTSATVEFIYTIVLKHLREYLLQGGALCAVMSKGVKVACRFQSMHHGRLSTMDKSSLQHWQL